MNELPATGRSLRRAAALALLVAATTLFLQVLVHRMVSAKLLNNYAFLVISLTMLGFAVSGVVLTRLLPRFLAAWSDAIAICASGFVLSALAASILFYHLGGGSQFALDRGQFMLESARWMSTALLFTVPFAFSGLVLGALLSDPTLSTRRVYAFDLAGSAVGAVAVIPGIRHLGVETSTLVACSLLLLGTVALAPPRRRGARTLVAFAALAIAYAAVDRDRLFAMQPRDGSLLALGRSLGKPYGLEYQQWDPVARSEVSIIPPPDLASSRYPALTGDDPALLGRFHRVLTQNDYAFTLMLEWDGRPESLAGIDRTIYAAAYRASSVTAPRVLVVGVGGGFDVLTALRYGASEVTGVEINAATLDIVRRVYRDYCGGWAAHPRVRLVEDEGRHYLATHPDRYDVLQLSGVDSYSGTPGAAHVFSESYLYTQEAFDLYLARLSEAGILNMMRLEYEPPREMLRALVSAVGALRRTGVTAPADHIMMLTSGAGDFSALLVKKTAFTREEQARLTAWADQNPFFGVSAAPARDAARDNLYQYFLDLRDPRGERTFVAAYPYDISPASDDRPFFFKYSFWSHLWPGRLPVQVATPVTELGLLMLAGLTGLAALVCVWLPLRLLVERPASSRGTARFAFFFATIGAGYFALEIALLQRFGLFLGHPNYALSVLLAVLLAATGAGALVSGRILALLREIRFVAYALGIVIILERLLLLPQLPGLYGLPLGARVLLVVLLVSPMGLLLGVFLPTGLERLKRTAPGLVPWAWGVNGMFSVLAPVLAVAVSVTWGIDVLLLSAVPVYLAAGWLLPPAAEPGQEPS